ncbi:MAG: lytic transglycosylase, partial [Desulfosarcina sp.]|nr:lytic transglycosylase [Desulfobacterales bacterium]
MPSSLLRMKFWSVLLVVGLFPVCGYTQARMPDLISAVRISEPIDFCGEAVPLGNDSVRERFEKEMLISLWDRDQAVLWLKRSTRFLPAIEAMLAEAGMPDDLKYVAIAESAL